jgi:hypothetical protein
LSIYIGSLSLRERARVRACARPIIFYTEPDRIAKTMSMTRGWDKGFRVQNSGIGLQWSGFGVRIFYEFMDFISF